jgi:ferric-dicitrate binding protein FerR (iron transport regulator)
MNLELTVEMLLMDESFIDYCLNENSVHQNKWATIAAADPANKSVMEEARNWLHALQPSLSPAEINLEIEKVKGAIQPVRQADSPAEIPEQPVIRRIRPAKVFWRAAAALALLISLPLAYYLLRPAAKTEMNFPATFAETGMGERKKISLPDGTTAILKSNSRILLDEQFNETERHIQLEGQAYFEVFPDASKPLTVHSGDFATTALGTAFFIDGNNLDTAYTVQLLEGKILVQSSTEKQQLLKPGFEMNWKKEKASFALKTFDSQPLNDWIQGNLEFSHHSAADVFQQLETWYGVSIIDQRHQKGNIMITGSYSDLPLPDILKAICFTLNSRFRIEQHSIIIE